MNPSEVDKDILLKWFKLNHSYLSIGSIVLQLHNIKVIYNIETVSNEKESIYFSVFVTYSSSTSKKSSNYIFYLPVSEYRSFIRLSKIDSILREYEG